MLPFRFGVRCLCSRIRYRQVFNEAVRVQDWDTALSQFLELYQGKHLADSPVMTEHPQNRDMAGIARDRPPTGDSLWWAEKNGDSETGVRIMENSMNLGDVNSAMGVFVQRCEWLNVLKLYKQCSQRVSLMGHSAALIALVHLKKHDAAIEVLKNHLFNKQCSVQVATNVIMAACLKPSGVKMGLDLLRVWNSSQMSSNISSKKCRAVGPFLTRDRRYFRTGEVDTLQLTNMIRLLNDQGLLSTSVIISDVVCVLEKCVSPKSTELVKMIETLAATVSEEDSLLVKNALLTAYFRANDHSKVELLFSTLNTRLRTAYDVVIKSRSKTENYYGVVQLAEEMSLGDFPWTEETARLVMNAARETGLESRLDDIFELFSGEEYMLRRYQSGFDPDPKTRQWFLNMIDAGDEVEAVFGAALDVGVVPDKEFYDSAIQKASRLHNRDRVLELLQLMHEMGFEPDDFTFASGVAGELEEEDPEDEDILSAEKDKLLQAKEDASLQSHLTKMQKEMDMMGVPAEDQGTLRELYIEALKSREGRF